MSALVQFVVQDAKGAVQSLVGIAISAAVFALFALVVKGRRALTDAKAAAEETRINAILSGVDQLAV